MRVLTGELGLVTERCEAGGLLAFRGAMLTGRPCAQTTKSTEYGEDGIRKIEG